jgi:hypothetical protein
MSQTQDLSPAPMLPLVTGILLVWHLALGADYLNARLDWLAGAPQVTLALALPQIWASVAWGLAVWLGLAASVFLIFRDDAAVLLLFAAAVSALVAGVGDVLATGTSLGADDILGLPRLAVLAALVVVPVVGWIYTRARHASGHLT